MIYDWSKYVVETKGLLLELRHGTTKTGKIVLYPLVIFFAIWKLFFMSLTELSHFFAESIPRLVHWVISQFGSILFIPDPVPDVKDEQPVKES